MIVALWVAGVVFALDVLILLFGWLSARRRRGFARPVVVVDLRGLPDGELEDLGRRLQAQRELGRALRGPRWTPTPQARA